MKKPASKAIKPSSRAGAVPGAVAGPSSKPASSTAGAKRKAAHRSPEVSGSDGEVEEVLAQPAKKKTTEPAANANIKATTAKGKGKAKADPPSKVVESVEQDSEAIEEFEALEPKPAARAANGAAKAKKAPVPAATAAVAAAAAVVRTEKSFEKEMARLRQRCEEVRTPRLRYFGAHADGRLARRRHARPSLPASSKSCTMFATRPRRSPSITNRLTTKRG